MNRARKYTYPPGKQAETQREWHAKNPGKRHEYTVRGKYGITPDRYAEMLRAQGGVCALCGQVCASGRNLGVDHDHACCPEPARSCGRCVRGLLCLKCNGQIGRLEDLDWMERAMTYLRGTTMGKLTARGEALAAGYATLDDTIPAPEEAASQPAADEAESPEQGADPAAPAPGVPDEPRETADDPAADARETREV